MDKRSVIFVINTMNVGGVEKALIGVLKEFLKEGWDVHVAMLKVGGGFMPYLPNEIHVHQIEGYEDSIRLMHTPLRQTIARELRSLRLLSCVRYSVCLLQQKFMSSSTLLYRRGFKAIPKFSDTEYDLAVAFAGPDAFIDTYVDKKINAKEKWGWIHFDVTQFGVDKGIIDSVYRNYTRINVVSKEARKKFCDKFPPLASKTTLRPNIIDKESIMSLAKENLPMLSVDGRRVVLTVGRVSKEKGQYLALEAIKVLLSREVSDFVWIFVGNGTDMERCKQFVENNSLGDYAVFVGSKANPYPYMKQADLYVQPSMHEGFCITLAEAKLFGMPIITTDFTGAVEQLESYHKSNIVPYDAVNLAEAVQCYLNE